MTAAAKARPAAERMPDPLFRCIVPMTSVGGMPYRKDDLSDRWGSFWPDPAAWSPENESARRLAMYYSRYGQSRFRPQYPASWDGVERRCYLPVVPLDRFHKDGVLVDVPAPVRADEVEGPSVPRYVAPGRPEFVFLSWPKSGWKAANASGAAVVSYMIANRDHPDFPPSPFNLFDLNVWLPKLRGAEKQGHELAPPPAFTVERTKHLVRQRDGETRLAVIDETGAFDAE